MLLLLASLVVTLVKSPCTRYYKKRKMHLAVMILLLGAGNISDMGSDLNSPIT